MMSLLMEAVITAFTLGAVISGLVAMHVMRRHNEPAKPVGQAPPEALDPDRSPPV